ncbi:5-(carboxyamino)imidazole ribonucleotide synthase [Vibrio metschnikovii]|uniref:5-(carboxyamino)imidazole ribonucleotide synthase n=1 Tax=Vibrio metschnikovii TaxID=28172 RepID=UPI002FC83E06
MQVLVLGAGQLARMMALAGTPLNIEIHAFDVTTGNIVQPITGQVIGQGLALAIDQADVITAEFEHIPDDVLEQCAQSGKLLPNQTAIKAGGNRQREKALLKQAAVNSAQYAIVQSRDDLLTAIKAIGLPMVLKSTLGGYDGKGQWRLKQAQDIDSIWPELQACLASSAQQTIIAEQFIAFDREVSLIGARGQDGSIVTYPLTENVHTNGVLSLSTSLDDLALQQQAESIFRAVAEQLDYVGVLALEFFDISGQLLVNEIAPRVHNSGHWTQQGAETCQFENHLRAVCGLPLGSTQLIRPTAMINILGLDSLPDALLAMEGCHVHWYGKQKRPGRKMGHINISADYSGELQRRLARLSQLLDKEDFPALHKHD